MLTPGEGPVHHRKALPGRSGKACNEREAYHNCLIRQIRKLKIVQYIQTLFSLIKKNNDDCEMNTIRTCSFSEYRKL